MQHTDWSCAGDAPAAALITLNEAAGLTPGRPDISCLWRWCRKGVRSRTGTRVCLEHRRVGGKLFTSRQWMDRFFFELSKADELYFAAKHEEGEALPARDPAFGSPRDQRRARRGVQQDRPDRRLQQDELDVELAQEGL